MQIDCWIRKGLQMETIVVILEIIGAVAFAASGALVGIKKNMDLFGVCVLGLSTAVGGGVIRDIILGQCPPAMFTNPIYVIAGLFTCIFTFVPEVRAFIDHKENIMLLADGIGLGIFTASGTVHALNTADANMFLAVFVGVVTGVGGGLLRDVMAEVPPYIFTKHIYALASMIGGTLLCVIYPFFGKYFAMFISAGTIVVIRILASRFRWNIPRAEQLQRMHRTSGKNT